MIETYSEQYRDDIIELTKMFFDEALKEYGLECKKEDIQSVIEICKKSGFLLIEDDKCCGVIGGIITQHLGGSAKAFQEVIWYVKPEYRRYGISLYLEMEHWCKENGVENIIMVCMHSSKKDKLSAFYERLGFKAFETQFIKKI